MVLGLVLFISLAFQSITNLDIWVSNCLLCITRVFRCFVYLLSAGLNISDLQTV